MQGTGFASLRHYWVGLNGKPAKLSRRQTCRVDPVFPFTQVFSGNLIVVFHALAISDS